MALLVAKLPTAANAMVRTGPTPRCHAAGNKAASANKSPSKLSQSAGRGSLGSLRARNLDCASTAALPIRTMTTMAAGLRNAAGLVYSTTRISAQQSRPPATTVLRCGELRIVDIVEVAGGQWLVTCCQASQSLPSPACQVAAGVRRALPRNWELLPEPYCLPRSRRPCGFLCPGPDELAGQVLEA